MHLPLEPTIPAQPARGLGWWRSAPLALFAFGIPLDVMIASRLGSSSLVLGVPLAGVVVLHLVTTGALRPVTAPLLLLLAFVGWGAVSVAWARDLQQFETRTITNVQLVVFVLLCWQVLESERALTMVLVGFVAGCLGAVADVWRAYLAGEAIGDQMYEGGTRFAADSFDPNDMGVTLAIGIPMAAYLALAGGRRARLLVLGYIPLGASAILLSGSRGSTVTGAVAILGVLIWLTRRSRAAFVLAGVLVVAGLVVAWHVVPEETWARILTLREQITVGGTAGDRVQVWRAGLAVFAHHPLVGVGAGGFPAAVFPALGILIQAHSTLLSIAAELGLVGLGLWGGAIAAILLGLLRTGGDQRRFGLALLATWMVGSASLTWEHRKTTWLVLLVCATIAAARREAGQGEPA